MAFYNKDSKLLTGVITISYMRETTRKKRDQVIETALKMFMEKGYENVSVDEIIAATRTSKGTFYHYFKGKDEILEEVGNRQTKLIQAWAEWPVSRVSSLEGHINRLFTDLADSIVKYRLLVRSLTSITLQGESALTLLAPFDLLGKHLLVWLPDPRKVDLLVTTYVGTLFRWCVQSNTELLPMLHYNLALAWTGLRNGHSLGPDELQLAPSADYLLHAKNREEPKMRVAIIGGGLAGLTAAAYLSEAENVEGILFERSPQLGGRAFTYEKEGFTLNYGAHAVYGIDRHNLTTMEKELNMSFSSKQVDKRRVVYSKNGQLTPAPLDFVNIVKTDLLTAIQKVRFVGEVAAIMAQLHNIKNYATLGDYLDQSDADDDIKELWEHLVCSNFFVSPEDARKVTGTVVGEYYHNLFLSSRPVNYVIGSWAVITNQLLQRITDSGRWEVALQEAADNIRYENRKFFIKTKKREEAFDKVVFAMPVQQVVKLLRGTAWEPFLEKYQDSKPTEVMVYDIGLSHVVARPFSYISDMDEKMFITDVSATDHTLVPEHGQLLQGVAYLNDDFESDQTRKLYLDQKQAAMEALFDKHYPGWQDALTVKRVSKKAMVSSVKNIDGNELLPNRIENVPFYFCGDGCIGKGELAERSFSSARNISRMILEEAAALVK
ncbi:MAG: TetR family transcriptional regulator [Paenibacillaceae bacterium]|jgi:protoporphyrinogen oxidase/AcrR family transcriptional regulator|nr:TetR family transcriptional regulator [Paenibacillaceae bacterium]